MDDLLGDTTPHLRSFLPCQCHPTPMTMASSRFNTIFHPHHLFIRHTPPSIASTSLLRCSRSGRSVSYSPPRHPASSRAPQSNSSTHAACSGQIASAFSWPPTPWKSRASWCSVPFTPPTQMSSGRNSFSFAAGCLLLQILALPSCCRDMQETAVLVSVSRFTMCRVL